MTRERILELERRAVSEGRVSAAEALELIEAPDDLLDDLVAAAGRVREAFGGRRVRLCSIVNARSGRCGEDCAFCAQSSRHGADTPAFGMISEDRILEAARRAAAAGATEFSIVVSGRAMRSETEIAVVERALRRMREELPDLMRCASLGMVDRATLLRLRDAGLQSLHHNIEAAPSFFPSVCTTHGQAEKVATIRLAGEVGLHVCCGGIAGMGESRAQRVELACALADLDPDCVPVNFLNPIRGTPLEGVRDLTPEECLRTLAVFRFVLARKEIVVCGGREVNLGERQDEMFGAGASGALIGDYLTTRGRDAAEDLAALRRLGLRAGYRPQEPEARGI
ncbi:MAG: biotin synthase BioB [Myxococcota bacterium]|nr:biotin synthase BioB [Myxococcota bacterium]